MALLKADLCKVYKKTWKEISEMLQVVFLMEYLWAIYDFFSIFSHTFQSKICIDFTIKNIKLYFRNA